MTYAAETKVPVDKSRAEIERTLKRYGADRFAYFSEATRAIIVFEAHKRRLRFDLPLPGKGDRSVAFDPAGRGRGTEAAAAALAKAHRVRWRALLLCIKAKLEAVESGIETFEEAFLAHVVLPSGETVGQAVAPQIASSYESGRVQPLLPAPGSAR